jgi:hypothetical protein
MNRKVRIGFCALALIFVTYRPAIANAQGEDNIKVHFDQAVGLPGHLLMPGEYIFRVLNPGTSLNTIQVTKKGDSTPIGFFQVIPTQRNEPGETVVKLTAADSSGIRRVDGWYLAGSSNGHEFTYSPSDIKKVDQLASELAAAQDALSGR